MNEREERPPTDTSGENTAQLAKKWLLRALENPDLFGSAPAVDPPYFEELDSPERSRRFELTREGREYSFGRSRSKSDFVLKSAVVSGLHMTAERRGSKVTVTDRKSLNGTLLNGIELAAQRPEEVRDGDVITIGPHRLRFVQPARRPDQDSNVFQTG